MRKQLKTLKNDRATFSGTFERYGTKKNWHGFPEKTILLKDVRINESNEVVTDHIWFNLTKGFSAIGELQAGDIVQFDARVKQYTKGYVNRREYIDERQIDYKLSHPRKIRKLG